MFSVFLSSLVLAATVATPQAAEAITRAAAIEAATDPRFDVISELDVHDALDFEASKEVCGASSESCASQIAGAYDARLVLFLRLYPVGDEMHAALTLRDLKTAQVIHRADVSGDEKALFAAVRAETKATLAHFNPDGAPGRTRLFIARAASESAGQAPPPKAAGGGGELRLLLIGGGVTAGIGVALGVMGTVLLLPISGVLTDPRSTRVQKDNALTQRTTGLVVLGIGGATLVAGLVAVVVDLVTQPATAVEPHP